MKEFDYIIIGGGCAGLSLAYELDLHKKLKNKKLAIIDPRTNYKKDKTAYKCEVQIIPMYSDETTHFIALEKQVS